MKSKRFLAVLLTLCMMFALFPTTALADGEIPVPVVVSNETDLRAAITDGATIELTEDFSITNEIVINVANLTIDGNSHTITCSQAGFWVQTDMTALTVKNLTLIGKTPTGQEAMEEPFMAIGTYNLGCGIANLTITDCIINGFDYGLYFSSKSDKATHQAVSASVTGTTIKNCWIKGAYLENWTDSTFDKCTIVDNGNATHVTAVKDGFQTWVSGIDINLKYGDYQNIAVTNSNFTNNGANNGAALLIKARGTGADSSYSSNPATLTSVTVTGCTFTNNNLDNKVVLGELGKCNLYPTNVTIGAGITVMDNRAKAMIDTFYYSTLADAVAAASRRQTVTLLSDTTENLIIDKELTIDGNNHTLTGTVTAGASATVNNLNVQGNGSGSGYSASAQGISLIINGGLINNFTNGVIVGNKNDTATFNLTMTGVTVSACSSKGVYGEAFGNLSITGCTFTSNGRDVISDDPFVVRSGSAIDINQCKDGGDVTITNNSFDGAGEDPVLDTSTSGAIKIKARNLPVEQALHDTGFPAGSTYVGSFTGVNITGNTFFDCSRDIVIGTGGVPVTGVDDTNIQKNCNVVYNCGAAKINTVDGDTHSTSYYNTLSDAVTAATSGQIITLLNDVALTEKLTINKDLTIDGSNKTVTGVSNNNGVYFEITVGGVTFKSMIVKNFGDTAGTNSGIAVFKVPAAADANTKLTADNITISDFCRSAFDISSGRFEIKNSSIDCTSNNASHLTKGIKTGYGTNLVTGTISNTTITNSSSTYEDWSTSAIEVYNNANVTVTGCTITNAESGIHVDNYWGSNGDAKAVISETTINAIEDAVRVYSTGNADRTLKSEVDILSGDFTGAISMVGGTVNDKIVISGGTFSTEPSSAYLADGYVVSADSVLGNYVVGKQLVNVTSTVAGDEAAALVGNTAVSNFLGTGIEGMNDVDKLTITLSTVTADDSQVSRITYDVTPMKGEKTISDPNASITFRLAVPSNWTGIVKVIHTHNSVPTINYYPILGIYPNKYIQLSSQAFSAFAIENMTDEELAAAGYVAKTANMAYSTITEAFAADDGSTVTLLADCIGDKVPVVSGKTIELALNGKTFSGSVDNQGTLTVTGPGILAATGTYNNNVTALVADTLYVKKNSETEWIVSATATYSIVASASTTTDRVAGTDVEVYADDTVTVDVSVTGCTYVGAQVTLTYNPALFILVTAPTGTGWEPSGTGKYVYYNTANKTDIRFAEGSIGSFTFRAIAQGTGAETEYNVPGAFTLDKAYVTGKWSDGWGTAPATAITPSSTSATIILQPMELTAAGFSGTYDGAEHRISVTGIPATAALTYSTDGNTYSDANPAYINFTNGDKTVYYKANLKGWKPASGSATINIAKAMLTPSVASVEEKTYDGTTNGSGTIVLTGAVGSENPTATGTFTWTSEKVGTTTVNVTGITLGNDPVNNNYVLTTTSLSSVTAPASISITAPEYEIEVKDYVAGKALVLVYTNYSFASYTYSNRTMFDVTNAGYQYGTTPYAKVFGIVVDGINGGTADSYKSNIGYATAFAKGSAYVLDYTNVNDVNSSHSVDLNDAVAVQAVYNGRAAYYTDEHMEVVLRSDVDHSKMIDLVDDAAGIKAAYLALIP